MKTIYAGIGLADFQERNLTKSIVLKIFQEPEQTLSHKQYSKEIQYTNQGVSFYYKKSEAEDPKIIKMAFFSPFEGKTEEGIILNRSTMDDVVRSYGEENWLTAEGSKYWWVEYSGIAFFVEKKHGEKIHPFHPEEHLGKTIVKITVPLEFIEDSNTTTEEGFEITSIDDFCIDGEQHEIIFDEERAEKICSKCGLIVDDHMISIEFSGQRAFSKDEQDRRQTHGSPVNPLIPDLQMATMIDKRAPMSQNLRKAVKWDSRYSWKQRNMIQATSEIKRIGELLNLPQHVKVYAIKLYRQAFTLGLLKGRSIRAMVAASIYYACGAEKVPRTLQNIVSVSDSTFHQITKCYQSLIKELSLPSPTIKPRDLLMTYISDLLLPHTVEILAGKILDRYEKIFSLSGKDPKGLVAAALYISAQHNKIKISQTKISRAVGITEVTLRNRLREMQKYIRKIKKV